MKKQINMKLKLKKWNKIEQILVTAIIKLKDSINELKSKRKRKIN